MPPYLVPIKDCNSLNLSFFLCLADASTLLTLSIFSCGSRHSILQESTSKCSCALQWIMETKYQVAGMSHILDDFCLWVPQNQINANKTWINSSHYALN
jgi:hypothetical protein